MGQKTNPLALRPKQFPKLSSTNFLESLQIFYFLRNFFRRKGFYLNKYNIYLSNSVLYIYLEILPSRRCLIYHRKYRRILRKRSFFFLRKNFSKRKNLGLYSFLRLFKSLLNISNIFFKLRRLDRKFGLKLIQLFWSKFKRIRGFSWRKNPLFLDLFMIGLCLLKNKGSSKLILSCIVLIFRRLPKRQHKKFVFYLKKFFSVIYRLDKKRTKKIGGFKFLISGKIGGKSRSKTIFFVIGRVPIQSFEVCIDYISDTSFTNLGSFGLKLWIAKKPV